MYKELLLTELRILLVDSMPPRTPTLKLCLNNLLFHYAQIVWNPTCQRFEGTTPMPLPCHKAEMLEMELYYSEGSKMPVVVGQGRIECRLLQMLPSRQIKIPLTYDGLLVGWIYCEPKPDYDNNACQEPDLRHLFIHKVGLVMLAEQPRDMELTIFKNQDKILTKHLYFAQQKKTIFTNVKQRVKVSDLIRFTFGIKQNAYDSIREVSFIVDHVKRGRNESYGAWLRNGMKNKVGQLKIQYFLENVYLENDKDKKGNRKIVHSEFVTRLSSLLSPVQEGKSLGQSITTNTAHNSVEKLDESFLHGQDSIEKRPKKTAKFRIGGVENRFPEGQKAVSRLTAGHGKEGCLDTEKECFVRKKKAKGERLTRIRQDGLDSSFYFGEKE